MRKRQVPSCSETDSSLYRDDMRDFFHRPIYMMVADPVTCNVELGFLHEDEHCYFR
jgi:hypothetical protein